MTDTIIQINDLSFHWPKTQKPALAIESWSVKKQDRCFLYGPSGSGKTTLLNIIAGLLSPQEGTVTINDTVINHLKPTQRDAYRAQHMGIIFQQFNLLGYLSVEKNITLSQFFSRKQIDTHRLFQLIDKLELSRDILDKKAQQLSIGQQQRVAVARALYHQPEIIIADEPTSALDTENRDRFIQLLLEQCSDTQSTVIFVSHDLSLSSHFNQVVDLQSINSVQEVQRAI